MWRLLLVSLLLLGGCRESGLPIDSQQWQTYRSRFISADGRVVDNGNNGISHSEGQGYGMLLAVAANDRDTFDSLWSWTQKNLRHKGDSLFAWKWTPHGNRRVPDRNNATDGDLLIAWALGRAARQFDDPAYGVAASRIATALRTKLLRKTAYGAVLLPGSAGFESGAGVALNPSYIIFPAYRELARWDAPGFWQGVEESGIQLLSAVLEHYQGLPPDWLLLDGKRMGEVPHAPLRFGYDALRVPLYVCWQGDEKQISLQGIQRYWESERASAWVALNSDEHAKEPLGSAHQAMRYLLNDCLADAVQMGDKEPTLPDDYYSATLTLLAQLARNERND